MTAGALVPEDEPDALEAENARLRSLVRDLQATCAVMLDTAMRACPEWPHWHELRAELSELGVKVDA